MYESGNAAVRSDWARRGHCRWDTYRLKPGFCLFGGGAKRAVVVVKERIAGGMSPREARGNSLPDRWMEANLARGEEMLLKKGV